jgi:hypothetical protein
LFFFFRASS